jgi:hypothetical protein
VLVNLGKKITDYGGDKEIQNMGNWALYILIILTVDPSKCVSISIIH